VLALFLSTPVLAVVTPEQANDWTCDQPIYPRNFIAEFADEVLDGFSDYENELAAQGKIHNDLDRLKLRSDFQQRWQDWLFDKGLPSNWKCPLDPTDLGESQNLAPITNNAATNNTDITKYVHHSIANNIPRVKSVKVRLYGDKNCSKKNCTPIAVDVYWNGELKKKNLILQPKGVRSPQFTLTMLPSNSPARLPAKTNQLKLTWVSGDFAPKIFVEAVTPNDFFPGSEVATPNNFYFLIPFGDRYVDMALGLACVNPVKYPESAAHIKDAQQVGFAKIVSPDRPGGDARRKQSTKNCKAPLGKQCDEYPQAMFLENYGKASVKIISAGDNQGSGSTVSLYARPYLDKTAQRPADNLEVIAEEPIALGNLYCKKRFRVTP
jgi:Deoxyribonuclease NucA/NucB